MSCRRVTVFGGTGFLGRRNVRHLQNTDFAVRIASRHPDRGRSLFSRDVSSIEPFRADVNDDGSVASLQNAAKRLDTGKLSSGSEEDQNILRCVSRSHFAGSVSGYIYQL